jgi:hypothetical protein
MDAAAGEEVEASSPHNTASSAPPTDRRARRGRTSGVLIVVGGAPLPPNVSSLCDAAVGEKVEALSPHDVAGETRPRRKLP